MKHFDENGALLGEAVSRSEIPDDILNFPGYISASNGRVGWYSGPKFGEGEKYLEIKDGHDPTRFPGIPVSSRVEITGLGLTDDGSAFVSTFDVGKKTKTLYRLDRDDKTWKTMSIPVESPADWNFVVGASAANLVLGGKDRFTFRSFTVK